MSISTKYNRTYHYDFSLGTTSDDRINREWFEDINRLDSAIHLEKMDGENTCMNGIGKFARSHAAPTKNPWSEFLNQRFGQIQQDLKDMDIEIFGENLYAIHSIVYPNLDDHFKVFAVRQLDRWLGWEEVKWYASVFDFHTVPEISIFKPSELSKKEIENFVVENCKEQSVFGSLQNGTIPLVECRKEGIVTRNYNDFPVDTFKENVFKYVRKDHVQTDEHWVRNWKRAVLVHEQKIIKTEK